MMVDNTKLRTTLGSCSHGSSSPTRAQSRYGGPISDELPTVNLDIDSWLVMSGEEIFHYGANLSHNVWVLDHENETPVPSHLRKSPSAFI